MKHSGYLNPSGCPVTSKHGKPPPTKHGGVVNNKQNAEEYNRLEVKIKSKMKYACGIVSDN